MHSIDDITAEILRREGGFVDDPNDLGGPTNFGVTLKTLRGLGIDIDGDGDVDLQDLRALTPQKAAEIFKTHYFHRPGIGGLPPALQPSVFDMYVNAGTQAVRILQTLLAEFGRSVVVDGQIGPVTRRAATRVQDAAPMHFADAYGIARRNYYYRIADQRPANRKFARTRTGGKGGWILRAEEFISDRWHLNLTEHRARIASWG